MEAYDFYWAKILKLKNEYDSFNFHGESRTTINILQSTQYIKLHLNLNLIIFHWRITLIKNNGIIYIVKEDSETSETYLLKSEFPRVIFPGLYTLKMDFVGNLTEDSAKNFFKNFYTNKENGIA